MTQKININGLKKLIREQLQLFVEEKSKKQLESSIDQQIDDYFLQYESDAKVKKNEGVDYRMMTRSFLSSINEAGEDEKNDKPDDQPENKKLTSNDIDVEDFAISVVRLIDNYDSLLEVRNTIARRAINFLTKNYEQDVVNEFKIVLEDQHDISLGKSKFDKEDEEFQAPPAVRSGGVGGGA